MIRQERLCRSVFASRGLGYVVGKSFAFFFLVAIIKKEFNDNSLRKGGRKKEKTDVTFFHADTNTLPRSIDFFFLLLSQ